MKILLYGVNYAPELTGIGKYSGEMAEWLADQGHDLRVVTAPPYYPEWRVSEGYSSKWYAKESLNGVDIWRCPLFVPAVPRGKNRLIHLASFAASTLPVMFRQLFWRPDAIVVVEPPLFCAPAAWLTARLCGAKCWLHIQDFEVDAAFDLGIVRHGWMKRFIVACERWMMRRFDVVSTISQSMRDRLCEKGIAKPELFPNWANLERMQFDRAGRNTIREELGFAPDQAMCLYSGNISIKQGLEVLLDVAASLPAYQFVICGAGVRRKQLYDQAVSMGLNNMTFLPLQPEDRLPAMLSAADIHLVVQKDSAADLVMPSKLTNILAVGGLAVVTAEVHSELGKLGEGDGACIYRCDPENAGAMASAIVELYENKPLAEQIREREAIYAHDHIDMHQVLGHFECRLQAIV